MGIEKFTTFFKGEATEAQQPKSAEELKAEAYERWGIDLANVEAVQEKMQELQKQHNAISSNPEINDLSNMFRAFQDARQEQSERAA